MLNSGGRIAAFALTVLATGTTAACGGGTPPASRTSTVAFLASSLTTGYAKEIADGFRTGVADVPGVLGTVTAPSVDNDLIEQVQVFQRLLTTASGGVSVSMTAPERFVDSLAAARAQGVPVIAVDVPPPPGSGVGLYVGNDNQELGAGLADMVISRLPADAAGTVLLGNPRPGIPVLDLRAGAVRAEFQKLRPGLQVLGPFDTSTRPDSNMRAWRQLLAANPHPLALLSVGADGASLDQLRQSAKATWLAAAFDIDPTSLAAVKRGELLLMSPEHFLKGAIAGRLQAQHADHATPLPKGWIYTAGLAITTRNVDSVIARQSSVAAKRAWFQPQLDRILGSDGPQLRDLSLAR